MPASGDEIEPKNHGREQPSLCFFGDMQRVIVENELDRCAGRAGGVELFHGGKEFVRPMPVFDAGVHHARQKIDAGEKAQRSVPDIFKIARNTLMAQGAGGKSGTVVAIACTPGFLVMRDDRHRRSLPGLLPGGPRRQVPCPDFGMRRAASSLDSWGIAEVLGFAAGEADNEMSALRR